MITLELSGVVVRRGRFTLGPLSLAVSPGETVCLAGPNGSGKTTLLEAIQGLVQLSEGGASLNGLGIDFAKRDHLRVLGVVPDNPEMLLEELTAGEYWLLLSRVRDGVLGPETYGRAISLAEELDFFPGALQIRGFSHGMRKKTQIVAALMHNPQLIIVDELRNGLDPLAARSVELLLERARIGGAGVLAASHDLFWADRNADTVHILRQGRVLATGAPANLRLEGESSLEDSFLRLVG